MDYELISYALGLAIFGGFVWAMAVVSFNRGVELGERMADMRPARPAPQVSAPRVPLTAADAIREQERVTCKECHMWAGNHAPDCPNAKPKPDRRRWMGFSRIKAELENKESASA